jgi:Holliday junction resolvase RusA-like endonuclease
MNKKYRVILAADPLTPMEQDAVNSLTAGGAAKYVTEFKKEIEKYKNLEPGQYEKKIQEIIEFYLKSEEITNELSVKIDLPMPLATKYVDDIIDTYGLGRPDTVNLISSVLNSSSGFGFNGDDAIEYMRVLLGKFRDPNYVAKRAAEDFKSMQELANITEIQPIEIYDVFIQAIDTGNFAPVWAIVTIAPLLKIDLINKDTKNVKPIIGQSVRIIQKFQGIALPLSKEGSIINQLAEASNDMKLAFNPILEYLTETLINRQIAFFNLAKRDFQNKPETFKALYDSHNKLDADFYNLQERRDLVNKPSTLAPASNLISTPEKSVKAKNLNKYKIIVAGPTTPASSAPATTATTPATGSTTPATGSTTPAINEDTGEKKEDSRRHNVELRGYQEAIDNLDFKEFEIDQIILQLENYLTLQPQGLEGDNILSFLNEDEANALFEVLKVKNKEFKEELKSITERLKKTIDEQQDLTPSLDVKRDAFKNHINKAIEKSNTHHLMKLNEITKKMRAAPYLKEFEDKKKTYDSAKARINAPSTKFVVPMKVFNPETKTFTRFSIPRGQFILHIGKIGEDCVALLRQLASVFASIGDKNSSRSSKRFLESANQLEAENEEFVSKNLNPFAPSVGEPR